MKLSLSMLFRPFALTIVVEKERLTLKDNHHRRQSPTVVGITWALTLIPAFAAVIVLCGLTPRWYSVVKSIETHVNLDAQNFVAQLMSEIERSSELVQPFNLTPTNLSRFINSNINMRSTTNIETQVAPMLFQASMALPLLTQITYIDTEDGRFFAYDLDVPQAIFNDAVSSSNYPDDPYQRLQTSYFGRSVNRDSGKLDGEAYPVSITVNETWFKHALNSSNGYTAVVEKWTSSDDLVFLSSAKMEGRGLLCLGFAVDAITNFITAKSGSYGSSLYLATTDGTVLVQGLIKDTQMMVVKGNEVSVQMMEPMDGDQQVSIRTVPCSKHDGASEPTILDINNKEYMFYCSPMDMMGVQLVYALAFERHGLVSFVSNSKKAGLRLLTTMILLIIIFSAIFVFINIRSIRIETHLSSSLTKQMEATEKAERQSTNKSIAMASATHDIRASLAGLTGLIDSISRDQVPLDSAVATNLKLMDTCVKDLHGLLDSILDTSKIEAGKMELDEEEFDISQLLEDIVDLYHPVAMKKGVDVILDPCDGSLFKHLKVKGDRGKLRQILCNLLSNAVKFTDKGCIKVRAWAQKPSLKNSVYGIAASNGNDNFRKSLMLFWKKTDAKKHDAEAIQVSMDTMEFVFEVEDSGKGIPKDKRQSVFENYVQVKETAVGRQGGTGLGLGIVKSLVSLMHGDITIVDKNLSEEGTCFRFNILLTTSTFIEGNRIIGDEGNQSSGSGQTIPPTYGDSKPSPISPRLSVSGSSPKLERSHVILLIKDQEHMTNCRRFMENMGIIVWPVETWEQLSCYLKNITKRLSHCSLVDSSDTSRCDSPNEEPVNPYDSPNSKPDCFPDSIFKKSNAVVSPCCVLLVIDSNAGPMDGLAPTVAEFRRTIPNPFKLVWLEGTAHNRKSRYGCFDKETMDAEEDIIVSGAFHGRKLYEVAGILPELGGAPWQKRALQPERAIKEKAWEEMLKPDNNDFSPIAKYWTSFLGPHENNDHAPVDRDITDNRKFLSGMKILVVEDSVLLRRIALALLQKLGALVEQCTNGEEAVEKVRHELEKNKDGDSIVLPYHYILMDCEMPVVDGYEATGQIRAMEKEYGLHIPIIALTAHTSGSDAAIDALNAGMDSHLNKPLSEQKLREAIAGIRMKRSDELTKFE